MAKGGTFEYDINFNINKQNLNALQKSLDEIIAKAQQTEKILPDYAGPFTEAAEAAKDFKNILTSSWNSQIGQLDLQKVEKGFINLYGSTKDFKTILSQIGPESQKTFNAFSRAILNTQFPVKQTSAMLDKLAISFKNTVRYGISSSIWNNFSNSVKQAYSYVKDLDKSLNDIRIVSGQSANQMERLARQANKTAQELGKSTLDYTKAALIYYQQGLSGQDVTERTKVTLKMANVLGESAKEVSNYMTAIWNNFDKGSESLEHFADVITALGATTASSSQEIAEGLSKFAAVADTVGLSYEYATAALATVVAQTRQSADVVGTAFKTLFARIQDLELGKTLDDGTTLGKYALALQKIGINIKDSSGELKNMNTILNEMGEKWKTLNDAQKVALAQNVAGTRQYTQLIALMDNWGDFQTNLATAGNADGTLEKQQEIYLDSIEAHLQQLDTAWEGLYKNIFDEDALKFFADALTKVINLANTFVTGLGGGLNSIIYIAMTLGNVFSGQISEGLVRMRKNAEAAKLAMEAVAAAEQMAKQFSDPSITNRIYTEEGEQEFLKQQEINLKILHLKTQMNEADQLDLDINEQKLQKLEEEERILSKLLAHKTRDTSFFAKGNENWNNLTKKQQNTIKRDYVREHSDQWADWTANDLESRISRNKEKIVYNRSAIEQIGKGQPLDENAISGVNKAKGFLESRQNKILETLPQIQNKDLKAGQEEQLKIINREIKALDELQKHTVDYKDNVADLSQAVNGLTRQQETLITNIEDDTEGLALLKQSGIKSIKEVGEKLGEVKKAKEDLWENKENLINADAEKQQMQQVVSGLFTIGSTISAISGAFQTLFSSDIEDWGEKLRSIGTVLLTQSMILFSNWDKIKNLGPTLLAWSTKQLAAEEAENVALVKKLALKKAETVEDEKQHKFHLLDLALNLIKIVKQAIINGLKAIELMLTGKIALLSSSQVLLGIAVAAAIGAAIYGAVKLVSYLIEINSEEYKLTKAVEDTKKAAQEANEAYKEIKDTFDSYKDARKNIDDLTEGTIEFYEAIQKSNEAAEQLIEKLGLVAGTDYGIDANGLINIDEDKLNQRMFAEQQKTFRAEARKYEAQLNLEKYNQKKIVEQFRQQTAVGVGYARYGFSEQVARDILNNPASEASRVSEMYGGQLERINTVGFADVTNAVEGSGKNIQGSIDQLSVDYKRSAAQQASLDNLIASNLILGYGSQSDVAEYNKMTSRMQEQVRQNIIRTKENNTNQNTAEDKNFWDYLWSGVKIAVGSTLGGPLGGMGTAGAEIYSYVDNAQQKKIVKEDYMKHVLGYQKNEETGTWYDRRTGATIDYDEVIDSIDTDEARDRYNSGEYVTQRALQAQVKQVENYRKQLMDTGLSKTSQNYVIEALMGNKDSIGLMSEEELKTYLQNRYNNIDADQLIANAKNGTFAGSGFEKFSINSDLQNWISNGAGNSAARFLEEAKAYRDTLADQAETLGTSAEALDIYSYAMDNAAGKTHKQNAETAEAAAAQYKFNKAYNEGRVTYANNKELIEKYAKALKNNKEISYDLADAVGEVSKSLKQMGLSLSAESLSKHLSLVNKLLSGTEKQAKEAYEELYKISQMDTLKYFFGDPKDLENGDEVLAKYQAIIDAINETEPGKGMSEYYSNQLADMINKTELTVTQIKELADQLNIEIPVKIKDPEEWTIEDQEFTQKAQAIHHRYKGEMPDPSDPSKNLPVDYEWTEFIEDKTDHFLVPKNTSFKVNKNTQNISKGQSFSIAPSNNKSKSGGSNNKPDKKDPITTEIDRYHKVNTQITKVDNSLKKLQSQQEKLVGSRLIENLTKQWELLNTQINNYTEKLEIANGEQAELAEKLKKDGVLFNEDGTVRNYAEAIKAQEDYVNSIIDKYNKMSKTQQESYKKTVEQAEKDFDKFKTNIDRYDELVSDFIPQLHQSIQDSIDKQIELNVEKFNLEITVTLDLNQATRDWNAWARRAIYGFSEEDILGKSEARAKDFYTYFNNNGTGDVQISTKHVKEILEELGRMDLEEDNVYGDNRAKGIEELKERYTELMGKITDVIELQDELHQNWLDKMDEVQEKFDEQINSYEFLREILNHDLKVVQLAYGDDVYDKMTKFYEQQQDNYEKQLDFQRQQKDFWYAEMKAAEEGTKEWESARDKWKEAVKEFNSILQEGLQNAIDKFKNAINLIFKNLNNSLTSGLGLDYVQTQWDLINKNADRYLDTINATYSIRELEKKYTDAINKADSISKQQKIRKVMEEQLTAVKEKERLTQYDIDRANKLYEIEMARIALEEARNNKSQMRLRRDSQGNYRYQYTADLDAVKKAQDDLDNLYNSLYNFDKERYNAILNDIYTTWNEYQQKMAEAALINDPELRAERQRLIQQEYNELMMQIEDDYQISKYNLQESFFNDWVELNDMELDQFKLLTDNEKNIIMTEMVPTWENGLSQMGDAFYGEAGFAEQTKGAWQEIKDATKGYDDDLKDLEDVAGITFEAIADGEDTSIEKAKDLIKENQGIIDKYGKELHAVEDCYKSVRDLIEAHKDEMDIAKEAAEAAYKYYSEEAEAQQKAYEASEKLRTSQKAAAEANAKATASVKTTTTTSSSPSSSSKSSSSGNSNSGSKSSSNTTKTTKATYTITLNLGYDGKKETKNVTEGDSVTLPSKTRDGYTFNGWDIPSLGICSNGSYTYKPKKSETVTALWTKKSTLASALTSGVNALLSAVSSSSKTNTSSWIKTSGSNYGLKAYATGGYTGDWNDGGRLAVLHQKELVLNQTDTKNMLNAVSIMRNLSGTLGTEMLAKLGSTNAPRYTNGNSGASLLEQDVHIDATFPNVRNAAEIEEALNNLVNAASQRAMINR